MAKARKYPDPKMCKTQHVLDRLYECISEDAWSCPYVMSFGRGYYCKHPDCPHFKEVHEDEMENTVNKTVQRQYLPAP